MAGGGFGPDQWRRGVEEERLQRHAAVIYRQQITYDNPESTRQYSVQDSPLSAFAAGALIRNDNNYH